MLTFPGWLRESSATGLREGAPGCRGYLHPSGHTRSCARCSRVAARLRMGALGGAADHRGCAESIDLNRVRFLPRAAHPKSPEVEFWLQKQNSARTRWGYRLDAQH